MSRYDEEISFTLPGVLIICLMALIILTPYFSERVDRHCYLNPPNAHHWCSLATKVFKNTLNDGWVDPDLTKESER